MVSLIGNSDAFTSFSFGQPATPSQPAPVPNTGQTFVGGGGTEPVFTDPNPSNGISSEQLATLARLDRENTFTQLQIIDKLQTGIIRDVASTLDTLVDDSQDSKQKLTKVENNTLGLVVDSDIRATGFKITKADTDLVTDVENTISSIQTDITAVETDLEDAKGDIETLQTQTSGVVESFANNQTRVILRRHLEIPPDRSIFYTDNNNTETDLIAQVKGIVVQTPRNDSQLAEFVNGLPNVRTDQELGQFVDSRPNVRTDEELRAFIETSFETELRSDSSLNSFIQNHDTVDRLARAVSFATNDLVSLESFDISTDKINVRKTLDLGNQAILLGADQYDITANIQGLEQSGTTRAYYTGENHPTEPLYGLFIFCRPSTNHIPRLFPQGLGNLGYKFWMIGKYFSLETGEYASHLEAPVRTSVKFLVPTSFDPNPSLEQSKPHRDFCINVWQNSTINGETGNNPNNPNTNINELLVIHWTPSFVYTATMLSVSDVVGNYIPVVNVGERLTELGTRSTHLETSLTNLEDSIVSLTTSSDGIAISQLINTNLDENGLIGLDTVVTGIQTSLTDDYYTKTELYTKTEADSRYARADIEATLTGIVYNPFLPRTIFTKDIDIQGNQFMYTRQSDGAILDLVAHLDDTVSDVFTLLQESLRADSVTTGKTFRCDRLELRQSDDTYLPVLTANDLPNLVSSQAPSGGGNLPQGVPLITGAGGLSPQGSPFPLCIVDSNYQIISRTLADSLFLDQQYGATNRGQDGNVSDNSEKRFNQGLVPKYEERNPATNERIGSSVVLLTSEGTWRNLSDIFVDINETSTVSVSEHLPDFQPITANNRFAMTSQVNGGTIVYNEANTSMIQEHSTNLYHTPARVNTLITDKLADGSITTGVIQQIESQTLTAVSDKRLKTNIKHLEKTIEHLEPVEFEYLNDRGKTRYGFIAQEVQQTHPELVETDSKGFLSVKYLDMIALLVRQNQELSRRIIDLENRYSL